MQARAKSCHPHRQIPVNVLQRTILPCGLHRFRDPSQVTIAPENALVSDKVMQIVADAVHDRDRGVLHPFALGAGSNRLAVQQADNRNCRKDKG